MTHITFDLLLLAGSVHLIALISPGPDFALILRNSIMYSKRTGLCSAFGIALGVLVHIAYTLTGLNFLASKYPQIIKIIGFAGATYLFWIGLSTLRSKDSKNSIEASTPQKMLSPYQALSMGFFVNVINPKCIVYFVSFLSTIIAAAHDQLSSIFIGIELFMLTWLWFSFLAIMLGHKNIQLKIQQYRKTMDKCVGLLFLFFGLSMVVFIGMQ